MPQLPDLRGTERGTTGRNNGAISTCCSPWPCTDDRWLIDDFQPEGILWLASYRAGRWEQQHLRCI